MHSQNVTKMLVLLLAICCLVPLAALAAVLYLAAPMWLVALVGLLAVALLARRLMALLATNDEPGFSHELSTKRRLSTHDHRQH
jgi:type IV secretory pathway TrbD component